MNHPLVNRIVIVSAALLCLFAQTKLQYVEAAINTQQPAILEFEAPVSANAIDNIIPKPVVTQATGGTFTISADTTIIIEPGDPQIKAVAQYLADKLKASTGYKFPIVSDKSTPAKGNITLATGKVDETIGDEGYELTVTAEGVTLRAPGAAGLFYGVQTLRQLFPAAIESSTVQTETWTIPTGTIRDYPRFTWRGAMLDVARHFFKVEDIKRYLDLMAYYKLNRFHLHLSDDQGWRIVINSWDKLATYGGSTEVGGGEGGYYTQKEYSEIVAYAQSRYITVIPEIDMPGHTNAALASYPELNCNGVAPALYTQTQVGFSSLCVDKEITYKFVEDVVKELAAITPGKYIHIGGDESQATKPEDYLKFMERVQKIVLAAGKQPIGWEEMAQIKLDSSSVIQHWANDKYIQSAVAQGAKIIMSPASKAYLDMKYDRSTKLGLDWAGLVDVKTGYNWNPASEVSGVTDKDILGVEAPLWSETLNTIEDIEYMAFPRLPGYAEIGWSPVEGRGWDEYQVRLGTHGARLSALDVNYFKTPMINWK